MYMDNGQCGLLFVDSAGKAHSKAHLWRSARIRATTIEGQVLEFSHIQVYFCLQRHKCTVHGRIGALVRMVFSFGIHAGTDLPVQGTLQLSHLFASCLKMGSLSAIIIVVGNCVLHHTTLHCGHYRWTSHQL